jgi:hypothetical protein
MGVRTECRMCLPLGRWLLSDALMRRGFSNYFLSATVCGQKISIALTKIHGSYFCRTAGWSPETGGALQVGLLLLVKFLEGRELPLPFFQPFANTAKFLSRQNAPHAGGAVSMVSQLRSLFLSFHDEVICV